MSDNIKEQLQELAEINEMQSQMIIENFGDGLLKNLSSDKVPESCYVCGSKIIYKYDGKRPICEKCAYADVPDYTGKEIPFTTDEKGRRIFDISNTRGKIRRNSNARPGDLIKGRKKLYEIQEDYSFKRIDKNKKVNSF